LWVLKNAHPNRLLFLAPAASLIGTGPTEALMLDVELAPENPYSNQLTDAQLPDAEGITPEQRLDAIAAILAIASLRNRYRKANNANNLKNFADSPGTFGEGLDSSQPSPVIEYKELKMNDLKNKKTEPTKTSVLRQLATLQSMSLDQIREKWLDLYGTEPPQYKKQFLVKRLAHQIQELFYGGLSEQAKSHLKKVAETDPVATVICKIPEERKSQEAILSGTRFVRIWNDQRYEVIARESGFEYDGRIFRSLSAIAREITGTRWNGKIFFGLKNSHRKKEGGPNA